MTHPPSDRGQGRKALPPEDKAMVRSLRLTAAHWEKFRALGGIAWMRAAIQKARTPK